MSPWRAALAAFACALVACGAFGSEPASDDRRDASPPDDAGTDDAGTDASEIEDATIPSPPGLDASRPPGACDEPSDCGPNVCCAFLDNSSLLNTQCVPPGTCMGPAGRRVCKTPSDCPGGQTCTPDWNGLFVCLEAD